LLRLENNLAPEPAPVRVDASPPAAMNTRSETIRAASSGKVAFVKNGAMFTGKLSMR
jgi:hypothetical protein